MRKFVIPALLAGSAFAMPVSAAQIFNGAQFFEGNTGLIDNKVKAFSDAGHPDTGLSVFGQTTAENLLVKFTGNNVVHVTSGGGYAQINDPTLTNTPWNMLTIEYDSYAYGFTGIEWALQFMNADIGKNDPGTMSVRANFTNGDYQLFSQNDFVNPGNRSFYLLANSGFALRSIVLSSGADRFDQLKQTDINAAPIPPRVVPEPATWALMIAGFGLAGGMLRRRATKVQFA